MAADEPTALVDLEPARKVTVPTELRAFHMPVDAPVHAILRFRMLAAPWQYCVYDFDTDTRQRFIRTWCSTEATSGLGLIEASLEVAIPQTEGLVEATLVEPPPCANSPRSYDGKTVIEGGRFFPGASPSQTWVAVMDEVLVDESEVEARALELASAYGIKLELITWGPYGFSFTGSYSKAKSLSFSPYVRFVEAMVEYRGAGWSTDSVLGIETSWSLDRLDQRESGLELNVFSTGDEAFDHRFRYPESASPLSVRPRLLVVDTVARTTHVAFNPFPMPTNVAVTGANAQCALAGGNNSFHGTAVLSNILGAAGTLRIQPRESLQIMGLGLSGAPPACDTATEPQVVNALVEVGRRATQKDVVVLSFGSSAHGMQTEMAVNGLARLGIVIFAATGNERRAALYPPASADGAISVGAIDRTGLDSKWANLSLPVGANGAGSNGSGTEVDFYAPGVEVVHASDVSNIALRVDPGTSFSAPFVAGLAAYYLSNGANGAPEQMRSIVNDALLSAVRVRTATQIAVPFTPTQPLIGGPSQLTKQILAESIAYDGDYAWVGGLAQGTNGPSLLRVPVSSGQPIASSTEVVESGTGSRCLAVSASDGTATTGCWSSAAGGKLTIREAIPGGPATLIASFDVPGVPVAVAADVATSQTTAADPNVRALLSLPVASMQGSNPILGEEMQLTVLRRQGTGPFVPSLVSLGLSYNAFASLALNCPHGVAGSPSTSCSAFALLTHANNRIIRLFRVTFDPTQPNLPLPPAVLIAERTDMSVFNNCFVPGWASGEGLVAGGLAVDDVGGIGQVTSRWSFSLNRLGTNYINGSCAFDSSVTIVNDASPMLDVVGRRGEAWSTTSRSTYARTTLAVATVWNPTNTVFESQLRSAIRTMHPRGAAPISQDIRFVSHSTYGQDAMALSSSDGVTWSIASVQP